MSEDDRALAALIKASLAGESSNGQDPEAFGGRRDVAWSILQALARGGISAVRATWLGITRRHPELAALVSADQDHSGHVSVNHANDAEPEQPKPGSTSKRQQTRQTQQLLVLATSGGSEGHDGQEEPAAAPPAPQFFHTPDHEAFVTFSGNGHLETWSCKSKAFRRWLSYQFFLQYGRTPRIQAVQEVLQTIEGRALFDVMRPVILTGIEELATRGDLLDRAIVLYLPAISDDQRRPEAVFRPEFEAVAPRMLGALFQTVSTALSQMATVQVDKFPRMADFALWVTAAESEFGWKPGSFIQAYTGNREAANELTLEANPIAPIVRKLAKISFTGTASELLDRLNSLATDEQRRQKGWPANGRALSGSLRRIAPNLRAVGINVEFLGNTGSNRDRLIVIRQPIQ
jgi:hypothetical protein